MSRRRNRNRGGNRGQGPEQSRQGGGGGGGAGNRRRRGNARNRGKKRPDEVDPVAFWGDPQALPEPRQDVRMTDQAAAVPTSLGAPPLPGHETVSQHYFGVVYDRAVMTAGALAAAGGLIDADELAAAAEDE